MTLDFSKLRKEFQEKQNYLDRKDAMLKVKQAGEISRQRREAKKKQ